MPIRERRARRTALVRFLAASVAAGLVGGVFAVTAPAVAAEAPPSYVVLGDSFSAGTGARGYTPESGTCYRSTDSYSAVWSRANPAVPTRSFACSGARAGEVFGSEATATVIAEALAGATKVSMSLGGNDIGFGQVLQACAFGTEADCVTAVQTRAIPAITSTLPATLDAVYARMRALAPQARVEIVGYPRLFDAAATSCALWSPAKRQVMNAAADRLAEVTAARAEAAGFRFVDVRETFDGHGVCSGDPWIRDALDGQSYEWLHPTAAGYAAEAALLEPAGESSTAPASPVATVTDVGAGFGAHRQRWAEALARVTDGSSTDAYAYAGLTYSLGASNLGFSPRSTYIEFAYEAPVTLASVGVRGYWRQARNAGDWAVEAFVDGGWARVSAEQRLTFSGAGVVVDEDAPAAVRFRLVYTGGVPDISGAGVGHIDELVVAVADEVPVPISG